MSDIYVYGIVGAVLLMTGIAGYYEIFKFQR